MGTNYYARILPTKERKQQLHNAIDADDFSAVKQLTQELFGKAYHDYDDDAIKGGVVHLGKRSTGWKFLWNSNAFVKRNFHYENGEYISDPSTLMYLYPLTKQGIHDFIFRDDVLIYDEYHERQDKEEFFNMALSWGYGEEEGWDAGSYETEHHERILVFKGEFTDALEREGYQFSSRNHYDFYSDGLRFSTSTDFS